MSLIEPTCRMNFCYKTIVLTCFSILLKKVDAKARPLASSQSSRTEVVTLRGLLSRVVTTERLLSPCVSTHGILLFFVRKTKTVLISKAGDLFYFSCFASCFCRGWVKLPPTDKGSDGSLVVTDPWRLSMISLFGEFHGSCAL